jgi:hypothetical protein
MPYATIQPPFTLKFREMSKKELREYFHWFFEVLPKRTSALAEAVRESRGFETWEPDQTPGSLDMLGDWFATQVETRRRTEDERQEVASCSTHPIEIPGDELTNRTFSLAIDVGMYLSQVLLRNHPSLRWQQPLGSKKFIDYGQPVLVGFGAVSFNPVRMLVTMAYALASKKETGKGLRDLYNIWSKMVPVSA